MVKVSLPTLLLSATAGQSPVEVEGSTVRTCVDQLLEIHPRLRVHLFDEGGALRPHVNLFLNDRLVDWQEGGQLSVREGDEITVLQAVSGG